MAVGSGVDQVVARGLALDWPDTWRRTRGLAGICASANSLNGRNLAITDIGVVFSSDTCVFAAIWGFRQETVRTI